MEAAKNVANQKEANKAADGQGEEEAEDGDEEEEDGEAEDGDEQQQEGSNDETTLAEEKKEWKHFYELEILLYWWLFKINEL